MFKKSILMSILISVPVYLSSAVRVKKEDALLEVLEWKTVVKIPSDGREKREVKFKKKPLKVAGIKTAARFDLVYFKNEQTFEVKAKKTILSTGQSIDVPEECCYEKSINADGIEGFYNSYLISIIFPQVELYTCTYLRYHTERKEQAISGVFDDIIYWGEAGLEKDRVLIYESEIPLYFEFNDPENVLEVIKDQEKPPYKRIEIKTRTPFCNQTILEPCNNSIRNEKYRVWTAVSSCKDFHEYLHLLGLKYREVIGVPDLPRFCNQIISKNKIKAADEISTINDVILDIHRKIRYHADTTSPAKRLFPRSFKEVSKHGLGDCKDFSSVTVAILRKLGYKAHVAWVENGDFFVPQLTTLPILAYVNHAIVRVITPTGKKYWIDPTVEVAMSGQNLYNFAGRLGYVIGDDDEKYCKVKPIPEIQSTSDTRFTKRKIKVLDNEKIDTEIEFTYHGPGVLSFWLAALSCDQKTLESGYFKALSDGQNYDENFHKIEFNPPFIQDSTKEGRDYSVNLSYSSIDSMTTTNLGEGLKLKLGGRNIQENILNSLPNQTNDHFFDVPGLLKGETIIEYPQDIDEAMKQSLQNLNRDVQTPWVSLKYNFASDSMSKNKIIFTQEMEIKSRFFPAEAINSSLIETLKIDEEEKKRLYKNHEDFKKLERVMKEFREGYILLIQPNKLSRPFV